MTEKEKAKELIELFTKMMEDTLDVSYPYSAVENIDLAAKKAALIAVDEIMECVWLKHTYKKWGLIDVSDETTKEYWLEVKKEINLI